MNAPFFKEDVVCSSAEAIDHLEANVQHCLSGRVSHFHLDVHDGGLILQGQAGTYYAKQLAQHAVMQATRLPILANEIEVCRSGFDDVSF